MPLPRLYLLQQTLPEADAYHRVAPAYPVVRGAMATSPCHTPFTTSVPGIDYRAP